MATTSRRDFIKVSALASGMLLVPNFLHGLDKQGVPLLPGSNGKRLIVIQLTGGNDGLNTVVPYRNDLYYKARPSLAIPAGKVLTLDKGLGLNPAMEKLRLLYDQGHVAVLNSVGYPDPDRSHFRSMDIWHSGSASQEYLTTGWLGRYLDNLPGDVAPHAAIEVDDLLSLALKGDRHTGLSVQDVQRFYQASNNAFLKKAASEHTHAHAHIDYLYNTLIGTQQSAAYLQEKVKVYRSGQVYPKGEFANNLKTIAELIASGVESRVYYASLSGFDTHVRQAGQQGRLLREFSEGIYSLVQDLKQHNEFDHTLIMVFSEFGRRVEQNASNGTDHGTANNLFLIGGGLKRAGIYNEAADLQHLEQGDLRYCIDFRNVYATLLQNWLQADAGTILGAGAQVLPDLV
ncbi:twin-arginine translocation pathway signal [Pontibacter sp. HJ8]